MKYLISVNELPVLKNKILYFYSSSFNYHEKYQKMISKIENNSIIFAINIESDNSLIKRFNLKSVPTFIFYKNNKEIDRFFGLISYKDFLKKVSMLSN